VPVVARDDHLAPVESTRLTPTALRRRFAEAPAWHPELPGDGGRLADRTPTAASVLVPLVARPEGVTVLLTRRTDHLHDHAGQISFPGGRAEPEELDDPVVTALREAEEEVGLRRHHVEVIGRLPLYSTVTAYQVTPVVALVEPGFALELDAFEVAEAFEVPLQFLMTPAHHHRHAVHLPGGAEPPVPLHALAPSGSTRSAPECRPVLHLGRHRRHAAQPLRFPVGLSHSGLHCISQAARPWERLGAPAIIPP
jgi:8-oxo-dGTP pyrophosphatase MutT (NUDIX family)